MARRALCVWGSGRVRVEVSGLQVLAAVLASGLRREATAGVAVVFVLVTRSCPTLCHPVDCSPPDSSVRGILQARLLEWSHFLLQGIFPTQGLNLCLLH